MESCNVWFLCLVSFIWQGVFKVHQPCNLYEYSIFFNGSVIFCCKYIPLFVYPFISWWAFGLFLPFGCCEQCSCEQCVYTYILVWIPVFSSLVTFIQVKLWGHMVILSLTFWGTAKLFSKVSALLYSPTSNAWGFKFHHIFASTWYFLVCFFFL